MPSANKANLFPSADQGYPKIVDKIQPWKKFANVATGPEKKSEEDDHLVVACPKNYAWGSSGLGGSWSVLMPVIVEIC